MTNASFLEGELLKLGLRPLEVGVYLTLLSLGEASAGSLAKASGQNRSTVYVSLKTLKEKGLVSESAKDKVKIFNVSPLAVWKDFLAAEVLKVKEKESVFNSIESSLKGLAQTQLSPSRVKIFEGKSGVLSLLLQSLWEKPDEIDVFGNWESFKEDFDAQTQRRIEERIPLKLIAPDSEKTRRMMKLDKHSFRETRRLKSRQAKFPGGILITNKEVILVSLDELLPVGVRITNSSIARTLKEIFHLAFNSRLVKK